jgi:hypothetical protein
MISLQLVLGSPVLWAQVEALEMGPVRRDAKRDTDKASQVRCRVGGSVTSQVHFDGAVLKGASCNDGETASIIQALWTGIANTHGGAAQMRNRLRCDIVEFELVQSEARRLLSLLTP